MEREKRFQSLNLVIVLGLAAAALGVAITAGHAVFLTLREKAAYKKRVKQLANARKIKKIYNSNNHEKTVQSQTD